MHSPEALILRRCYPVPVTFKDLRRAYCDSSPTNYHDDWRLNLRVWWNSALKEITGALDEVYAIVDGQEVRVAIAYYDSQWSDGQWSISGYPLHGKMSDNIADLMHTADRAGYWARPHEVRINLQEQPVSHETVARAVLVGQEYVEQHGDRYDVMPYVRVV